jgi:hypothetical protein
MCTQRKFNKYFIVANAFMVQAGISTMLLRHTHEVSPNAMDAVSGVLYGITIGFYILALVKSRRDGDDRAAR